MQQQPQQQLSPAQGNADSFVFLKDVAVVQNDVASASVASSPAPFFLLLALALLAAWRRG